MDAFSGAAHAPLRQTSARKNAKNTHQHIWFLKSIELCMLSFVAEQAFLQSGCVLASAYAAEAYHLAKVDEGQIRGGVWLIPEIGDIS